MSEVTKPKKTRTVKETGFRMSAQIPKTRLSEATVAAFRDLRTAAKVASDSEAVAQFVEHVVRSGAYSAELAEPSGIPEIVVEQARAAGCEVANGKFRERCRERQSRQQRHNASDGDDAQLIVGP